MNSKQSLFQPNILVVSGGASKGIGYVGVLESFIQKTSFELNKLKFLSGSSAGGIICTGICLGYNCNEIKDVFLKIEFKDLCPNLFNEEKILPFLYNSHAINNGEHFKSILSSLIKNKGYNPDTLTFKELYNKSKKHLILTGSNLTTGECDYFSHEKTPDMLILTAVLITSRMPYVFPKITYNNCKYVDGETFDPFPIRGISKKILKENKKKIIGLMSSSLNKNFDLENIVGYSSAMMAGMLYHYKKKAVEKYKKYTVFITPNVSFFDFNIDKQKLLEIYETGKKDGVTYLLKKGIIT